MKWRDPDEARKRLFETAQSQAGYFNAGQAVQAGYSRRLHTYHTDKGHWIRIERGTYRLRDYPTSRYEDLVRCSLTGGTAVVSHETAAAVHDLGDLMPSRIHLTVPPGYRQTLPAGVVVHRGRLGEAEFQTMAGFRVTSPIRTIMDLLLGGTEAGQIERVVSDALARGAVRTEELEGAAERLDDAARDRLKTILRNLQTHRNAL